MTEPAKELSNYYMKSPPIKAVEIDKQWLQWLVKEKGFTQANLGDFYLQGLDGEQVMPRERFERLFIPA